jgi:hypothetical protein
MSHRVLSSGKNVRLFSLIPIALSFLLLSVLSMPAQNDEIQQRIAELKESMAKNKQALAQYTWKEQVTISIKGEQKKIEDFQVRVGPDGKPQKTSLDPLQRAQAEPVTPRGRLRQRIVERKKEEFEDYAEQMKALVQRYIPPDKDAIQDAFSKGNISITPAGYEVKIVIRSYVKENDSMTIVFNEVQKLVSNITVASYMDDPADAMNLEVHLSSLPDGTSHVSSTNIEGTRKQLTVHTQNSDYRKL